MKPASFAPVALLALAALAVASTATAQSVPNAPPGFAQPVAGNPFASGGDQVNAQDAQGFMWDINSQGTIIDGSDDCFDGGMVLTINGSEFNSLQRTLDPKTKEFVLTGTVNGVEVSRRIYVDAPGAFVRYVEMFTNTSRREVTIAAQVATELGVNAQTVISDTGNQSGTLGAKDRGLLAVQQPGGSRPSMMLAIAGTRGQLRPQLAIDGRMIFRENYSLSIPARKTVAVLHAVAQRRVNGVPPAQQLATMFKPFTARDLTRGLSPAVRRAVVNWRVSGGSEAGLRLAAVAALAEYLDVERGKQDVLYFDENARLIGKAEGESVEVATANGSVTIPWKEVALLAGGADVDRTPRVYLRNGEVLTGEVQCGGLKFHTETGVEAALAPEKINYLFAAAEEDDGKPDEGTLAYVQTRQGDRLALHAPAAGDGSADGGSADGATSDQPAPALSVLTPWGPVQVPLSEVAGLVYLREPQPGHVLVLKDHTRLAVMPSGSPLVAASPRLGRLTIAPRQIAGIEGVGVSAEELLYTAEANDEPDIAAPHCVLAGGNALVGTLAAKQLALVTGGGVTALDVGQIQAIELQDDEGLGGSPTYTVSLKDGGALSGQLQDAVISVQTPARKWRVPARQLLAYYCQRSEDEEGDGGGGPGVAGASAAELLKQAENAAQNGQFARARQLVEQAVKVQDDADEATREKIQVYLRALQQIEGNDATPRDGPQSPMPFQQ